MSVDLEKYRQQIEAALAYGGGTHLFEDVADMVAQGRAQVWINGDTIGVTEIIVYPRKKVLNGWLAGGNLRELMPMMPAAAEWGRAQGCEAFTIAGRPGWLKVMKRLGFEPGLTLLEAKL